ncbi:Uncharacterized protein DBV15_04855 [Temnothorax longispinosus]|uniref:Uncharacterized protein n=1 Tax=Temnothorax longispinosus TaxID=300112 RepID=A0A4S2KL01_9HYME|nr:Uncharacterized protein DBV15_04855 [Temnothorax longispinosus]
METAETEGEREEREERVSQDVPPATDCTLVALRAQACTCVVRFCALTLSRYLGGVAWSSSLRGYIPTVTPLPPLPPPPPPTTPTPTPPSACHPSDARGGASRHTTADETTATTTTTTTTTTGPPLPLPLQPLLPPHRRSTTTTTVTWLAPVGALHHA